jgi:hypothetical protein
MKAEGAPSKKSDFSILEMARRLTEGGSQWREALTNSNDKEKSFAEFCHETNTIGSGFTRR